MTLVKCSNCGAERELTYEQMEVINREERHCPSCGVGKERVVIREEKFRPFSQFIAEHVVERSGVTSAPVFEIDEKPEPAPAEPQEPAPENVDTGISVGPGGAVGRRRRPAKLEE